MYLASMAVIGMFLAFLIVPNKLLSGREDARANQSHRQGRIPSCHENLVDRESDHFGKPLL